MATEIVKSFLAFEETMFVFLIVHLNVVPIEGACQYVHFDIISDMHFFPVYVA